MKASQVAEMLKGKVVKEVKYGSYLHWSMTIDEIIFEDGTVISMGGNADEAYIYGVQLPNGEYDGVESDKPEDEDKEW